MDIKVKNTQLCCGGFANKKLKKGGVVDSPYPDQIDVSKCVVYSQDPTVCLDSISGITSSIKQSSFDGSTSIVFTEYYSSSMIFAIVEPRLRKPCRSFQQVHHRLLWQLFSFVEQKFTFQFPFVISIPSPMLLELDLIYGN